MFYSHTPFAYGPTDKTSEILSRIGEGRFDLTSGNWTTITPAAKVFFKTFYLIMISDFQLIIMSIELYIYLLYLFYKEKFRKKTLQILNINKKYKGLELSQS